MIYNDYSYNIPDFQRVIVAQVFIDNEYVEENDAKIILSISDSSCTVNYYWMDIYLISFSDNGFNEWQTGQYNYEYTLATPDPKAKNITLTVLSGDQKNELRNVRIRYLRYK